MHTQDFAAFVESQQNGSDAEDNWIEIRQQWLGDLKALYDRVEHYLGEFIEKRLISTSIVRISLTEENIGTYFAPQMDVKIGRKAVSLEPIGTLFIACRGRVDVVGTAGRRRQLLLLPNTARSARDLFKVTVNLNGGLPPLPVGEEPVTWAWKIVASDLTGNFIDFDKDTFSVLLMSVADE